MKKLLLVLLFFPLILSAEMIESSLGEISEHPSYEVKDSEKTEYPKELMEEAGIAEDFPIERCRDSFVKQEITHLKSGITYFAYYSTEDQCDGGNSYGLIAEEGTEIIVALIQDGDFVLQ